MNILVAKFPKIYSFKKCAKLMKGIAMETGIKYDKDKPRMAEMIIDFAPELQELCRVWMFGADKYSKSNWKLVENGKERYSNALLRHLMAEDVSLYDDESKLLHSAHIAFNALARMHFIMQEIEENQNELLR